jgi:osmotically-inducible protein OsmY
MSHDAARFAGARETARDDDIRARILAEIARDPALTGGFVDVWSCEGVVGLAGSVTNDYDRRKAERVARGIEGVQAVVSYIDVVRPA